MQNITCYHCGEDCDTLKVFFDEKHFCCNGCKTVYEIFSTNGLSYYYDLQSSAGSTPNGVSGKYDFLDNQEIVEKLLEFNEEGIQVVELYIPQIHCSSCIWVLENLNRLHASIKMAQVNFPKKKIRITYDSAHLSLKQLVVLLAKIGYGPSITLDDYTKKQHSVDRSLLYKLGVAGFAFGNVMLLSFPEYFDHFVSKPGTTEYWLDQYKVVFRWLMFAFSLPVVCYAAKDYFISAFKGLRSKLLNIDVPIALGIFTLFTRSTIDILLDQGSGFFDSLAGLVFFLLVGKFFQQKTYSFLSFERDYKSYFPIAVTKLNDNGHDENIPIHKVKTGDRILIHNQEILPVDGVLISGDAQIDYSFVTGESQAVHRTSGDKLHAGGKQLGGALEIEVLKSVSQSYLTQLWSNSAFSKNKASEFQTLTDSIGKRFTLSVLTIAILATVFWLFMDPGKALNVFTAVLIIACPCAIALAAPFTLGNMLRIFGQHHFYVKDTNTIERMAKITAIIFDKTGTLTSSSENTIVYEGMELTNGEAALLKNTLRVSNHPLSRSLYKILKNHQIYTLDGFEEETGKGIHGKISEHSIKVGSANYVGGKSALKAFDTSVYVSADENYKGRFVFKSKYRSGLATLFKKLTKTFLLFVVSGDNEGEKYRLKKLLPFGITPFFNQKPEDKLRFVKNLQQHQKVLMVGDGLNDAGALAQSDVGIAISENINVFSPACDAILEASKMNRLSDFLWLSKNAVNIIKASFLFSLCYNIVGLYFAVIGQLQPIIAAILMPLSSISIVIFATMGTTLLARRLPTKN
ncbi:MAG: heavy metal translocating P-type ATPase metal-binding domain-containing protein [Bacteroidota bacterium]